MIAGVTDRRHSGACKGKIDPGRFTTLIAKLNSSDFTNLTFPSVDCCDGAVTTLIIYANGKRTFLKSMTPPEKAQKLISFLYVLGTQSAISSKTVEVNIEE
jgi:hypothetical protein